MEKKFVSIVVYLHNNEANIRQFLALPIKLIREYFENYEFVFVDDECQDQTLSIISQYLKEFPGGAATIVRMGNYQGLEASMNAGRDISIGDFVFEFDTTIVNYEMDTILQAYHAISSGADIAIIAPNKTTRLSSRVFYGIFNHFSHGPANICSDTFRIISRRAVNRIRSISDFVPYRKALYANCGLKVETIFYKPNNSDHFVAEGHTYERINLAFDSFIYFTDFLEKISSIISVFFLVFSIGSVTYALWDYFVNGSVIEGWTSIICFLSFGFLGVFILLTIVLKYLAVILNLVFKKQKYLVSSIERIQ